MWARAPPRELAALFPAGVGSCPELIAPRSGHLPLPFSTMPKDVNMLGTEQGWPPGWELIPQN